MNKSHRQFGNSLREKIDFCLISRPVHTPFSRGEAIGGGGEVMAPIFLKIQFCSSVRNDEKSEGERKHSDGTLWLHEYAFSPYKLRGFTAPPPRAHATF